MAALGSDLENVLVGERDLWLEGPPHELFKELRGKCPCTGPQRSETFLGSPAIGR